jgi:hypothetical protein
VKTTVKTALVVGLVLGMAARALGQGQFVFNNRALPDVDARMIFSDGTYPSGTDYYVQLFGGPSGTPTSTWTELGTTDFRTGAAAGYVDPITVTVPGAMTSADLELRIFPTPNTSGPPLATVFDSIGRSVFTTPVAVAPNPPPNLPLGTSPLIIPIPEPSTYSLILLGVSGLLFHGLKHRGTSRQPAGRFGTCSS